MRKVFQTNSRTVEIQALIHNIKPAVRLAIYNKEEKTVQNFLQKNNLKYATSDFYITEILDKGKGGFSNKGIKTNKPSNKSYKYYYISKQNPNKIKKAEDENNHILFGKLLGYPDCCTEFFNKHWPIQSKRQNDYVIPALTDDRTYPYQLNICGRYFDQILISHFPCSFNCKASLYQAKKIEQIIKPPNNLLKSTVIYTEFNGVFLLNNGKIYKTIDNHISKLLEENKIEIINNNQIKVGKYSLEKIHVIQFV